MSKLKEDFEAHKTESDEHYKHFSSRLDHFANYLQSAMNPTVKLRNGEEQEIFMSEAVVIIYDDLKHVKKTLNDLDGRTEILKDFTAIKQNFLDLKYKLKKYLKPLSKFIVMLCVVFLMLYLLVMVAAGRLTAQDAYEFFMSIIKR